MTNDIFSKWKLKKNTFMKSRMNGALTFLNCCKTLNVDDLNYPWIWANVLRKYRKTKNTIIHLNILYYITENQITLRRHFRTTSGVERKENRAQQYCICFNPLRFVEQFWGYKTWVEYYCQMASRASRIIFP